MSQSDAQTALKQSKSAIARKNEPQPLEEYWMNHTTKIELESIYTIQARTWSDEKYVLLVQNRVQPENSNYVSYAACKKGMADNFSSQKKDVQQGAFFNLMEQQEDGTFSSKFKLYMGSEYTSQVFISTDLRYVAVKLSLGKNTQTQQFDIFRGLDEIFFFNGPGTEKGKDVLQREYRTDYVATLELPLKCRVSRIGYSAKKRFAVTYSSDECNIFDLGDEILNEKCGKISNQRVLKPLFSYHNENKTFSRIIEVFLGKEGNSTEELFNNSWIVLLSKQFSQVHIVPFQRVKEWCAKHSWMHNENQTSLESQPFTSKFYNINKIAPIFFEGEGVYKFSIDGVNQSEDFWKTVICFFSPSGNKAVVLTKNLIYKLNPNGTSFNQGIKLKQYRNHQVFLFESNDNLVFLIKNDDMQKFQFDRFDAKSEAPFQEMTIDYSNFDMRDFKIKEIKLLKNGTHRLIGIRAAEQVMIMDQKQPSQQSNKLMHLKAEFRDMFPSGLLALQMPFIAYAIERDVVNIVPLFEEKVYRQRLDFLDTEEIVKLVFTSKQNLFVISCRPQHNRHWSNNVCIFVHKLSVGIDIQIESNQIKLKPQMKWQRSQTFRNARLNKELGDEVAYSATKYGPLVFETDQNSTAHRPQLRSVYIFDETRGNSDQVSFVFDIDQRLYFATTDKPDELVEAKQIFPDEPKLMRSISRVNQENYLIHFQNSSKVWHLNISEQYSKVEEVYTEFSYELLAVQSNESRTYMLVRDRKLGYHIRIFQFDANNKNNALQQTSFISCPTSNNTREYINVFNVSNCIIDGVFVHNENKFSRIYDNSRMPSIKYFSGYLPDQLTKIQNMKLMTNNIQRNTSLHKLALVFNFPPMKSAGKDLITEKPRECYVIPFFNDNEVQLQQPSQKQITWMTHSCSLNDQSYLTGLSAWERKIKATLIKYDTAKWKLIKFDIAGICRNKLSLKNLTIKLFEDNEAKLKDFHLLEFHRKEPKFLFTPTSQNYLKHIALFPLQAFQELESIDSNLPYEPKTKWDTSKLMSTNFVSLHSLMRDEKNLCRFAVNDFDTIAIALQRMNSDILTRLFIVKDQKLIEVTIDDRPKKETSKVKASASPVKNINEPLIDKNVQIRVEERNLVGFELTETKIIAWSQSQLFYCELPEGPTQTLNLLEAEKFKLKAHDDEEEAHKQKLHSVEVKIVSVSSRNPTINPNDAKSQKTTDKPPDIINVKVQTPKDTCIVLQYDLNNQREINSIETSANAEFLYDEFDEAYVYSANGLAKMSNSEMLFEYHVRNINSNAGLKTVPGYSWGRRLIPSICGSFLLLDNKIVLPYSLVSKVLYEQSKPEKVFANFATSIFYPENYYKINGKTPLHKFVHEPDVLEKFLDCYWKLDKQLILSVLVRSQTYRPAIKATTDENGTNEARKSNDRSSISQVKVFQGYEQSDKVILQTIVQLNHDKLINQILYMFSKLPINLTFKLTQPFFADLQKYARFTDYLDGWFFASEQLKQIRVLKISPEKAYNTYRSNLSILDQGFFKQYQIAEEDEDKETGEREAEQSTKDVVRQDDSTTEMRPVVIKVMKTSWLFEESNEKFETALYESENIQIFENATVQAIIDFQWDLFLPFYKNRIFRPYFYGCFLPFMISSLIGSKYEKSTLQLSVMWVLTVILWIYFFYGVSLLVIDYKDGNWTIMDWINSVSLSILLIQQIVFICLNVLISDSSGEWILGLLRLVLVWGVLLQNITLLNYLKVFDGWANFVRALISIIQQSKTLLICLAIFVLTQTFMFYILIQNVPPVYEDDGEKIPSGFLSILLNSYRFALGDFNILIYFENQANPFMFWFIFVISTLIQILIILNMLIAVMTATFDDCNQNESANIYKAKMQCLKEFKNQAMKQTEDDFKKPEFLYSIRLSSDASNLGPTLNSELPEQQTSNQIRQVLQATDYLKTEIYGIKNSNAQQTLQANAMWLDLKKNQDGIKQQLDALEKLIQQKPNSEPVPLATAVIDEPAKQVPDEQVRSQLVQTDSKADKLEASKLEADKPRDIEPENLIADLKKTLPQRLTPMMNMFYMNKFFSEQFQRGLNTERMRRNTGL